jgi:phospholipase/carboxylesterase
MEIHLQREPMVSESGCYISFRPPYALKGREPSLRLRSFHAVLLVLVALLGSSCGPDYQEVQPGQVRAFRIPDAGSDASQDSTLCLFSVPDGYRRDRPWPLLVALHGYGSSAARFHTIWQPAARKAGYVLLTPQGEQPTVEGIGWAWGSSAETSIRQGIDTVTRKVHIDRSRIFMTGFSQGGSLTYLLALKHPNVLRGIAPLGAGRKLPQALDSEAIHGMSVYIGHGSLEPGLEDVRELAARLESGGCRVRFTEYPGVGHALPEPISAELDKILEFFSSEE